MIINNFAYFFQSGNWIYAYEKEQQMIVRFNRDNAELIARIPDEYKKVVFDQMLMIKNTIVLYSRLKALIFIYDMKHQKWSIVELDCIIKAGEIPFVDIVLADDMVIAIPQVEGLIQVMDFSGTRLNYEWIKRYNSALYDALNCKKCKKIRILGNIMINNTIGCILVGREYDEISLYDIKTCKMNCIRIPQYKSLFQLTFNNGIFFAQGIKNNRLYLVGFDQIGNIVVEHYLTNQLRPHLQWWNNENIVVFEENSVYTIFNPWNENAVVDKKVYSKSFYFCGPNFMCDDNGTLFDINEGKECYDYWKSLSRCYEFCKVLYDKNLKEKDYWIEENHWNLISFLCSIQ